MAIQSTKGAVKVKRVGVRQFRDRATQYLAGDEVLVIERHGQPIGFYIPTGMSEQESFSQAVEQLEQTVQRVLQETGLTEDALSRLYDLNKPVPGTADQLGPNAEPASRAPGR